MAFTRKMQFGQPVPTHKDGEAAVVQLVEVTNASGGNAQLRVDLRQFVSSDRYDGPTKVGMMFDSPEAIRDLAACLVAAADEADSQGMGKPQPTNGKVTAEAVPVVAVNRNGVAAKRAASRRSTTAKQ